MLSRDPVLSHGKRFDDIAMAESLVGYGHGGRGVSEVMVGLLLLLLLFFEGKEDEE